MKKFSFKYWFLLPSSNDTFVKLLKLKFKFCNCTTSFILFWNVLGINDKSPLFILIVSTNFKTPI